MVARRISGNLVALAILLLLVELVSLSILVDSRTVLSQDVLGQILGNAGFFLRWLISAAAILATYYFSIRQTNIVTASDCYRPVWQILLIATSHIFAFVILATLTATIFTGNNQVPPVRAIPWIGLVLVCGYLWALIIASHRFWVRFFCSQNKVLLVAGAIGLLATIASNYFLQFWQYLNAFTLGGTHAILSFFYQDLYFEPAQQALGFENFYVTVGAPCSGIEGMVLATFSTSIYLYLARDQLRFPRALALIPIALLLSVLLNLVRIALLIVIGGEISPRLAVEGFHSVAGWLAAVVVALTIIFVFSSWKWMRKDVEGTGSALPDDDGEATLLPFLVLILATLIGRILFTGFDYAYPVKIALVGVVLWVLWPRLQIGQVTHLRSAVATGSIIAAVWILFSPANSTADTMVSTSLSQLPTFVAIVWILFRMVGHWLIIPLVEELVFRGYLLSRLSSQDISHAGSVRFYWPAVVSSSVLFGLLHDAWLSGILTGLMLSVLRTKTNSLMNCIVAHGFANLLVSAWVLRSGAWSLM